jgi:DNA invertase Pin-like site-specific DNA recombinase
MSKSTISTTRHIRVTINLRTDLDPGRCANLIIDAVAAGLVVISADAKEVRRKGRAPIDEATKDHVLSLRQAGGTYEAVAADSGLSRASVIRICKAEGA